MIEFLAGLRLTIHVETAHPRPVAEGLPFLGFTVFPTHRRLKANKSLSFRRKYKQQVAGLAASDLALDDLHATVRGWVNHVRYGDTWQLRRSVLGSRALHWEV